PFTAIGKSKQQLSFEREVPWGPRAYGKRYAVIADERIRTIRVRAPKADCQPSGQSSPPAYDVGTKRRSRFDASGWIASRIDTSIPRNLDRALHPVRTSSDIAISQGAIHGAGIRRDEPP
ncbi:MAG TPA: hypothetical protein VFQ46_02770, partial [Candidatus Limnocylindria bacterium]|nr:hypothetical protein [Candidatus Limnocylindria bacterium]